MRARGLPLVLSRRCRCPCCSSELSCCRQAKPPLPRDNSKFPHAAQHTVGAALLLVALAQFRCMRRSSLIQCVVLGEYSIISIISDSLQLPRSVPAVIITQTWISSYWKRQWSHERLLTVVHAYYMSDAVRGCLRAVARARNSFPGSPFAAGSAFRERAGRGPPSERGLPESQQECACARGWVRASSVGSGRCGEPQTFLL